MPNTSWRGENVFVSLAAGGHVPVTSDLPCARLDSKSNEILADAAIRSEAAHAGLPDQFLARNRPPKTGCSRRTHFKLQANVQIEPNGVTSSGPLGTPCRPFDALLDLYERQTAPC
jgi:hypothetical protein